MVPCSMARRWLEYIQSGSGSAWVRLDFTSQEGGRRDTLEEWRQVNPASWIWNGQMNEKAPNKDSLHVYHIVLSSGDNKKARRFLLSGRFYSNERDNSCKSNGKILWSLGHRSKAGDNASSLTSFRHYVYF